MTTKMLVPRLLGLSSAGIATMLFALRAQAQAFTDVRDVPSPSKAVQLIYAAVPAKLVLRSAMQTATRLSCQPG